MKKPSAPAMFMYFVIAASAVIAAMCFFAYYGRATGDKSTLWAGIVAFMIVYHLWLRIIMGNISKLFKINRESRWFNEKPFEKKLYRLLRVKRWKGHALTYNPELFDVKRRCLSDIADAMTKAEADHWFNEAISLSSILFSLIWGQVWIFALTAMAAMAFDMQFIIIQRYNRPRVLKILKRRQTEK